MSLKSLVEKSYYKDEDGILLHGDCLEVMKEIDDGSIDLIVTDPPYRTTPRGGTGNSGGMCKKKEFSSGKVFKHNDIKFEEYLPEFYRILKDNSHCYIMCNNKNIIELQNKCIEYGFHFIKNLIWNKGNKIMGQTYMGQYEYIVFLRKGIHKKINNCGTPDILNVPNKKTKNEEGKNIHDTEKPVELMKILIENSSNENDIIFEPFSGAGGTIIGAKELGRRYVGVELDEGYCEISKNRLAEVENQKNGGIIDEI